MLFPAAVSLAAAQLLALLQQLEATQFLPAAEMRARQFRQIGALVAHIDRAVPFYGVSLRKAGLKPGVAITEESWARVPVLTRRQVQDAGETLKARDVPAHHGKVFSMGTSGSSGAPVTVWKTELEQLYWNAFTLRDAHWQGYDFSGCFAAIRHDRSRHPERTEPAEKSLPDWGPPISIVYQTGPARLIDVRATVLEQVAWLERARPDVLLSFPSVLGALARHCLDKGVRLPFLRQLRSSGEFLPLETRALCRDAFGLEIADMYSAVEAGYLALQCPHGRYHLQSESALIEVLRPDDEPCRVGETGRVVVTALHNFAMPLIRYEIGDYAEIGEACPCGRTLPVLSRILGSARDMLRLPEGGWRFPEYGRQTLNKLPAVLQHQAVQVARDEIEFRLHTRRELTADEEAGILEGARRSLGPGFIVRLVYGAEIPRAPGGKFQEFRCDVPD